MQILPKVYTFDRGDIIAEPLYDLVAIRCAMGVWKHTNMNYEDQREPFDDASAEYKLEKCGWIFIGNRREAFREMNK